MKGKNQFGCFDIVSRLAEYGWKLEGEYRNAHVKTVFVCSNGHKNLLSWGALKVSFFCRECHDSAVFEQAKEVVPAGWNVVEVKRGKVQISCVNGHSYRPDILSEILKKMRISPKCSECASEASGESIRVSFEEAGWCLLEKYHGYHSPHLCVCPQGHRQKKRPSNWLSGNGCPVCSGLAKKSDDDVSKEFAKEGWKVLSPYFGGSIPQDCICPNGHLVKKSLDCLRISPKGCIVCSGQVPIHSEKKRAKRNERVKNWRDWTPLILERDGYRCVICGSEDRINAHHLSSYHRDIASRYDVDNGVTLCRKHHGSPFDRVPGSFHVVFGFMNNTKDQFEEYRRMCGESVGLQGISGDTVV